MVVIVIIMVLHCNSGGDKYYDAVPYCTSKLQHRGDTAMVMVKVISISYFDCY
jgi:hypothetical protein